MNLVFSDRRLLSIIGVVLFFSLNLAGCAIFTKPPAQKPALIQIPPSAYPEFFDDLFYDNLEYGILKSISYLKEVPATKRFQFGNDLFTASHLIRSLEHFLQIIRQKPSPFELKKFIESHYLIYQSAGTDTAGRILFTGYYEPILKGSLKKNSEYSFPVYARPNDMVTIDLSLFSPLFNGKQLIGRYTGQTIVPYYDRAEITQEGFLDEKAEQIVWVKDPVDLFFLQIQGSGKICLENGQTLNVHYHITNGRPYRSIGKLLIDEGKIPKIEMSMQKIRTYLRDHPEEVEVILNYNPSYVFFKIEKDGPLGYMGAPLTPGRSVALDWRLFPLSALAFVETTQPLIDGDGKIHTWATCTRFVFHHDTGGAIKGPSRADLFWGNGPYAEIAAGHLQHPGILYFLVLRPDAFP